MHGIADGTFTKDLYGPPQEHCTPAHYGGILLVRRHCTNIRLVSSRLPDQSEDLVARKLGYRRSNAPSVAT